MLAYLDIPSICGKDGLRLDLRGTKERCSARMQGADNLLVLAQANDLREDSAG